MFLPGTDLHEYVSLIYVSGAVAAAAFLLVFLWWMTRHPSPWNRGILLTAAATVMLAAADLTRQIRWPLAQYLDAVAWTVAATVYVWRIRHLLRTTREQRKR